MFKKLILSLLIVLFTINCENKNKHKPDNNKLLASVVLYNYQVSNCRSWSGDSNPLYFSSAYSQKFMSDHTQYLVNVVGDSTMDFSTKINGYLSTTSQSVAVAGNTLCDMQEQINSGSINTKNPQHIVIASAGGNDLAHKIPNDKVITSAKQLIDLVKTKFPNTKITLVGVHPSQLDYVNKNRIETNAELKSYIESKNGCYVNPDLSFTLSSDGYPLQSEMLDTIHYAQGPALKIRNQIIGCGVNL